MNLHSERAYLDHSSTTPLREEVLEAMRPYLTDHFGNAGSLHRFGREARKAVDRAREQVAALIGAEARDIVFTAGGTEADNLALRGRHGSMARESPTAVKRTWNLIVSAVEHHAVLDAAEYLRKHAGVEVRLAPVDSRGRVDPASIGEMIDDETFLVSVMHANNETGVIQPVDEIGNLCRAKGIPFHCDAVQSAGKIPVDVAAMSVSFLALSAHKMGGPKGVGALYARREASFLPQSMGGGQERGRRAGTENVAGIVGFGIACELAGAEMERDAARIGQLRDRLERGILETIEGTRVNGSTEHRLANLSNIGFRGLEGEAVMMGLDVESIAVATGAACTSGAIDPSHVLVAMGRSHEEAHSGVRFSLGRGNEESQIDRVLRVLPGLVERLRGEGVAGP